MTGAQLLRKRKGLDIAIIEPSDKHYYQPAWTLVGAGAFRMKKTIRSESSVMPKGLTWIKDAATGFDPEANTVNTHKSGSISYDYLVVAAGVQYNPDEIEGLKEALGKYNVCSNYIDPEYTWKLMQQFTGGHAVFTQPATPIRCGGAPQKIMYLMADYIRKHGLDTKSTILFATPGTVIFGTKVFAEELTRIVKKYNIALKFYVKPVKVDGPNGKVYFRMIAEPEKSETAYNEGNRVGERVLEDQTIEVPFDFLHLAPPTSAPDFVRNSPLAWADGPNKGWVKVNINTMQHLDYQNVFSLGDVACLPTAKTGAAIRKQAPVVVDNILSMMDSKKVINDSYTGYSSCPFITGYGKMLLAEFDYNNDPMPDPLLSKFINTYKEKWSMWLLKKYGLPWLYWNMMMKGRM